MLGHQRVQRALLLGGLRVDGVGEVEAGHGERVPCAIRRRPVVALEVVAQIVARHQLAETRIRYRPLLDALREHRGSARDVVNHRPHVPLGARRRVPELAGLNAVDNLVGTVEHVFECRHYIHFAAPLVSGHF